MTRRLTFVIPGDIHTRTGGYEYDRRMIEGLRGRGWTVTLCQLDGAFPQPSPINRSRAAAALGGIAEGSLVLVDGLALGVLPDEVLAQSKRLRIVGLVHHPLALETGLEPGVAARLLESERRALSATRHVVVTSAATARTLSEHGLTATGVSVVVPGTDRVAPAVGSGGAEVNLLCVGSIVPRKGHALLLRAVAQLEDLSWRLTCAGSLERDPETAGTLIDQVQRADLGSRVEFVGERSQEELAEHYRRADVFVLPTLYEGYGMVVAEAIAHGLPVVASDTGGIAEIVGGEAGIVFRPGDLDALVAALRRVISEPATRSQLAAGARRIAERLPSWDEAAVTLENALLKVSDE